MHVSDILDNVIDLSVGQNDVTSDEREKFLKYLNMAAEQLYRATASLDEQRSQTFIATGIDESAEIGVDTNVLCVSKVVTKNREEFTEIPYSVFEERKFLGENGQPIFCFRESDFSLYSSLNKPYDVFIAYTPAFAPFQWDDSNQREAVVNLNALFRSEWHNLLIYGTLYFIYQDMDGFKSSVKESIAASEWKKGISEYSAALFNSYPDNSSPHTRV